MKYLIIVPSLSLIVGFGLQFIKAWVLGIRFQWKKRHAKGRNEWIYQL